MRRRRSSAWVCARQAKAGRTADRIGRQGRSPVFPGGVAPPRTVYQAATLRTAQRVATLRTGHLAARGGRREVATAVRAEDHPRGLCASGEGGPRCGPHRAAGQGHRCFRPARPRPCIGRPNPDGAPRGGAPDRAPGGLTPDRAPGGDAPDRAPGGPTPDRAPGGEAPDRARGGPERWPGGRNCRCSRRGGEDHPCGLCASGEGGRTADRIGRRGRSSVLPGGAAPTRTTYRAAWGGHRTLAPGFSQGRPLRPRTRRPRGWSPGKSSALPDLGDLAPADNPDFRTVRRSRMFSGGALLC
ncbi:hypothetical protein SAMN05421812_104549 [Asanoa hainanensis]|uniref:Uncharacterized protein n=1 Tax=Asanoa hainanensis TaxID=560556 RepID=A0A239LUG0_9ACTN|nr:hypothetical protein SAMN05421812_104549 [Asanoa hainanensis]